MQTTFTGALMRVLSRSLFVALLTVSACVPEEPPIDLGSDPQDLSLADAGMPMDATPDVALVDAAVDALPPVDAASVCPSFETGVSVGKTPMGDIKEASGIVASRRSPGTLWVHNDSGASATLYALTSTGAMQAIYNLDGASAQDWEDIAIGPGPVAGTSYLYVGDIGDNGTSRTNIVVYRVPEPDAKTGSPTMPTKLSSVERITLNYPDKPHNAETLLVDPKNGDLYIVVKSSDGDSPVFRAAAPLSTGAAMKLEQVARLRFGTAPLLGAATTTGGDISPDGDEIAIRSYTAAYLWRRAPGQSIGDALTSAPCQLPLKLELQGEALGFALDRKGYFTVSEGQSQPIYLYARK
jgi:hypothetical protein